MPLNPQLEDLLRLEQLSGHTLTAADALRQQAAQYQIATQAPELLATGQLGSIGALSQAAGDKGAMLRQIVENQTSPKKAPIQGYSLDTLKTILPGAPEQQLQALTLAPPEQQPELLKTLQGERNAQTRHQEFVVGEGRRTRGQDFTTGTKFLSGLAKDFSKPLRDTEKTIEDSISGLSANLKAFQDKATPAALNLLIRSIIKATGDTRVSDQDIAGLNFTGLPNKADQLRNYLEGAQAETMTDEQKKEALRLAKLLVGSVDERKKRVLGDMFKSQLSTYPDLLSIDGTPGNIHPTVEDWAGRVGAEVSPSEKGGKKISLRTKEDASKLPAWVDKIADESVKTAVSSAILAGKYTTEQQEKIKSNIASKPGGFK